MGSKDIEEVKSGVYDKLKRQLKVMDSIMDYILENPEMPFIVFNSVEISCHSVRNQKIKYLLRSIQENFQIQHLALWLKHKLYFCSSGWNDIHAVDKSLLYLYEKVKTKAVIYDIPVYLTHTSLVDDDEQIYFGLDPYRYIILKLSPIFTLTLLCGPSVDLNELYLFIMKTGVKGIEKELSLNTMSDCAIYYEVPNKGFKNSTLSWMFLTYDVF